MSIILKPGTVIVKDPDAELPYAFDWLQWLGDAGLSDSEWSVSPTSTTSPLTVVTDSITDGATRTRVTLSGGEAGTDYRVRNRVTTNEVPPRIDDRSLTVRCKER